MAEWTTAIIERLAKQAEARAKEAAKLAVGEKDWPGGPTAALSSVLAHMHADVMKAATAIAAKLDGIEAALGAKGGPPAEIG